MTEELRGPLSGLRVVDHTDLRGALCGRILADLGADVVRTVAGDGDDDEDSLTYRYRNANKRLVRLESDGHLEQLLSDADVLIDNISLDPDAMASMHPH